jgi:uncharacterized protein (TIGR02246 family)
MAATSEIIAQFDRWNAALGMLDAQKVTECYAPDAILLPTVSNEVRHNHPEIHHYFERFLLKRPIGRLTESNVRVFGDIAINSGTYIFTLTIARKHVEVRARFTFVYRKVGTDWQIIEHHSSVYPEE